MVGSSCGNASSAAIEQGEGDASPRSYESGCLSVQISTHEGHAIIDALKTHVPVAAARKIMRYLMTVANDMLENSANTVCGIACVHTLPS